MTPLDFIMLAWTIAPNVGAPGSCENGYVRESIVVAPLTEPVGRSRIGNVYRHLVLDGSGTTALLGCLDTGALMWYDYRLPGVSTVGVREEADKAFGRCYYARGGVYVCYPWNMRTATGEPAAVGVFGVSGASMILVGSVDDVIESGATWLLED